MIYFKSSPLRLLLSAIALTICLGVATAQARLVDQVVAVVNGEVITRTELDKAAGGILGEISRNTPESELDERLDEARRRILDEMIEELLLIQKAGELRISVSDEEIDSAVATISSGNGMSVAELYRELERTGADREEYRRKLAGQIRRSKLISYEIQSKIVISMEEARDYYEKEFTRRDIPPGYHLLQFGINWGGAEAAADSKEEARTRVEGLRKLALAGQDFRELAESFSELPSANDGGDIGFFSEKELAESMRAIVVNLEPGEISEVIEVGESFQFFRLLARNLTGSPEFAPFAQVKEEIIDRLRQEELENRFRQWLEEIKEQAIIKKLI